MPLRSQHLQYFPTLEGIKLPRIITAIAAMIGVGIISATLFLIFTPWVQTTSGPGTVTALDPNDRVQEINTLVPGRIDQWYVQDGSTVKAGDPILKVADNDPLLLERLDAERAQLVQSRIAAETALSTAEIDFERTRTLFNDGLAARRDMELAQIKVQDLRSRVADANAKLARLDVDISRQSVQIVRAPRDGTILRVNAGDTSTYVSAGTAVATFLPASAEPAVEIFIDGRDVGLVTTGAKVRIQFESLPAIQVSGWPTRAQGTYAGTVIAVDPSAQADGRFRVLVTEDPTDEEGWPDSKFIRFGTTARGWVLLETVPLWYELWRQLNNFPPEFKRTTNEQPPVLN